MSSQTARPLLRVLPAGLGLALTLLLGGTSSEAGWRELKPIFGGAVNQIAVDAGGTLYASGSGGLFKSIDGGSTWAEALGNLPTTQISHIVPDPVEVGVVYVTSAEALYRTTDAGNTWARLPLNLPSGVAINRLAVAPSNTDYLFAATSGSYAWRSLDRGATWQQSSAGLSGGWSGPAYLIAMAVDPTNHNRVYTSTWRGRLFRSDDAAASWYQIADSGTWANTQIRIAPSSPNVLYTTHDKYWFGRYTVLRSTDYGTTWMNAGQPTGPSDTWDLAIDPTNADIVYAVTRQGIYKTVNAGATWALVLAPPAGPVTMQTVAVEPSDPSRVFAGAYSSGFYRSTDAGGTWSQHNSGLSAAQVTGIEICRDDPSRVYAGANGEGFFRSSDGGMNWSAIGTAQGLDGHYIHGLGVHPEQPDTLLVSTTEGVTGRVWRTVDGGASFSAVASYASGRLQFNPLAPQYANAPIGDSYGGFLLSANGGASWSVPHYWYRYPHDFLYHPTHPNVVLNTANRYTGAARNTLSIFYSDNFGQSWAESPAFGQGGFRDAALDQSDPTTLYVAGVIASEGTQGVYKFNVAYSGSSVVSVSRVAGTFNNGLPTDHVRRLVHDPVSGYLYASTPVGVFRSNDQAASWSSINDGLPYLSTDVLAVSPDGTRLLVGTSGGIWEFSESIPVEVATPSLSTNPPDLLIEAIAGQAMPSLAVTAVSTTAADTLLLTTTGSLPQNMTFTSVDGNPATGSLDYSPGGNQRGASHQVGFSATSTLDPTKSATLTRYVAVLADATTDASALIAGNSAGSVDTPDGAFTLHLAAGSIPGGDPYAVVNLIQRSQLKQTDARITGGGKAKILNGYDIDVSNQEHFTFALPVALTFAIEPGAVQDLADVPVFAYNEATDLWELRTDTSCLGGFGLQPTTGDAVSGGTVSVCTSTLSTWATVDMATLVIEEPPVAVDDSFATDEDVALSEPAPGVLANDTDANGDTLTVTWAGGPSHGMLDLGSDGSFLYTPEPDFFGSDSFTYLANDGELDSDIATVTITVRPVNDPPQALCTDAARTADHVCQATIVPAELDDGSYDPEGGPLAFALSPAPPYGLGSNAVTLEVTDDSGATSVCSAAVTVNDETPPQLTCPAGVPLAPNASCEAAVPSVLSQVVATDACSSPAELTLSQDLAPGLLIGPGSYPLTVTGADVSGNASTCQTLLSVLFDFDGFLPPINGGDATGGSYGDPVRSFKMGSTVPIKFRISCSAVPHTEGVHTLQVLHWSTETDPEAPIDATPADAATTGNQFRLTGDEWHYNLDTAATGMSRGQWQLVATLADGTQHTVWIQLK